MKQKMISGLLLTVALALIIMGAIQGDYMDTMHKAIVLCLECIGIG